MATWYTLNPNLLGNTDLDGSDMEVEGNGEENDEDFDMVNGDKEVKEINS